MEISKLTEGQAMDMGIVEAAIRQAERAAERTVMRNRAEYPSYAEHDVAEKLNAQVVYLYGHGTRAYYLTDVVMYANGDFIYSVRPLSGGMEWTYDRRAFSTKPFDI